MKHLGIALGIAVMAFSSTFAQTYYNLASTDHVTLQGYQQITTSGCDYGARMVNNTNDYVLVPKSKVKARFRYQKWNDSAGKWKYYNTTKNVNIPKIMLRPGSYAVRERDRNDSDDKEYIDNKGLEGEIEGGTITGHGGDIGVAGAVELSHDGTPRVVYEDDALVIEAWVGEGAFGSMPGFQTYPTHVSVRSKIGEQKLITPMSYKLYYHAIYNSYEEKVGKLKDGKDEHFKQNFDGAGYEFEPRVFIEIIAPPRP